MSEERPLLGSWAKTYTVVALLAVFWMALLWWLTHTFNMPVGKP